MTEPTWPEMAVAGSLFAVLTDDEAVFKRSPGEFESIEIDHGTLRLVLTNGQEFELAVRQVK
jgi:hypothetical protein